MQVEVQTPTNTMHEKHILLPQPTHNSGTMNVPLHADSMTDSSESSDDDQMLFDIMESHDDSHNKIVCLFSMFVMSCFDEAKMKHNMNTSGVGLVLVEERRLNMILKDPSRNWKSNFSMEKLRHIQRNSLRGDSVYQE